MAFPARKPGPPVWWLWWKEQKEKPSSLFHPTLVTDAVSYLLNFFLVKQDPRPAGIQREKEVDYFLIREVVCSYREGKIIGIHLWRLFTAEVVVSVVLY